MKLTFAYPRHTPSASLAASDRQRARTLELRPSSSHVPFHPVMLPMRSSTGYMYLPKVEWEASGACLDELMYDLGSGCHWNSEGNDTKRLRNENVDMAILTSSDPCGSQRDLQLGCALWLPVGS